MNPPPGNGRKVARRARGRARALRACGIMPITEPKQGESGAAGAALTAAGSAGRRKMTGVLMDIKLLNLPTGA